jgi:hypothetical protein
MPPTPSVWPSCTAADRGWVAERVASYDRWVVRTAADPDLGASPSSRAS